MERLHHEKSRSVHGFGWVRLKGFFDPTHHGGLKKKLWMHDLIRQMGREMVQPESNVLGKCTRLWCNDDALEVLTENTV